MARALNFPFIDDELQRKFDETISRETTQIKGMSSVVTTNSHAAKTHTTTKSQLFSLRWIINARDDLVWFIGSVLSSYLLLALYVGGVLPLIPMIVAWSVLIDAPHLFATFSRTYFDREERHSRKRLLWGSLVFFVVGPAMVLAGAGLLFFFLAALWAYYHLVKQHYGFMVLYKKKNDDLAPRDNLLDRLFLTFALACPFVLFVVREPEATARVPARFVPYLAALETFVVSATVIITLAWLFAQIRRAFARLPLNVPKYLLFLAAIPMHWAVLLTPMRYKPIAIIAMLTIYHNLQYHRLVWFYNKKYSRGDDRRTRYGAAEIISRRLLYYVAFGVLFGLCYQLPKYFNYTQGQAAFWTQLVSSFFWGFAFIHYYLDSKIWRVRRDPQVGQALRVEA